MLKTKNYLAIAVMVGCLGCQQAMPQYDDRSFYRNIDKDDWPGNDMSEKQTLTAVEHFADPAACKKPWRWALIGPNTFLLKGTDYLIHRRLDASWPNISYSKGYWGGHTYEPTVPVWTVKLWVEQIAADDCKYARKEGGI